MKPFLYKFTGSIRTMLSYLLYITIMLAFIMIFGERIIGLSRLSRTMGITISTFAVVGILFLNVYGTYDIGRRKSKPIIHSLILATICTDIITYLQVMIMKTTSNDFRSFRLHELHLLPLVILVQLLIIIAFVYVGNWLFFLAHPPEECIVITSSQDSLNLLIKALGKYKKQYKVRDIFDYRDPALHDRIMSRDTVFLYDVPVSERVEIMRRCYEQKVNVYFNPEVEDVMETCSENYILDDLFLINKNVKALTMEQRVAKRVMDICVSFIGGILLSPFMLIGMLLVKLDDGGPIFFKQERSTINGRPFNILKLRTMKMNVSDNRAEKNDARITKAGNFLRKSRIDEIPQLWNVFVGDMSLVGPRPELSKHIKTIAEDLPEFEYRLRMKAGLTGYAQIQGKYNTGNKEKLLMDLMYIEQFSIWKDIQLIMQTVIVILKMGASTEGVDAAGNKSTFEFIEYKTVDNI